MAAYLSTTHGAKRIFGSLAEYEAAHNAAWATLADGSQIRWNNIGGVAKFWWDKAADTLLMPDLTGLLREMAGYDSLGVGGTHGDAIRNITAAHYYGQDADLSPLKPPTGANSYGAITNDTQTVLSWVSGGGAAWVPLLFNAARVVPTAAKNQPRAWGALACCYLGTPAS